MDRSLLRFAKSATRHFSFLVDEYNFLCKQSEPTFVRYESDKVFIHIHHGRSSYEIGLQIGLLNSLSKTGYGIGVLISLIDYEKGKTLTYYVAQNPESVDKRLTDLAALLTNYGKRALVGDPCCFKEMQCLVDHWHKEREANQIRANAENAFRHRDYQKAIELYTSMQPCLSPAEKKKLDFAKRKALLHGSKPA